MKLSAWRRRSSDIIGGVDFSVETTLTRLPLRWIASTRRRKSPSPENSTMWSALSAISIASTASSMSIEPLKRRRPIASVYSLVGFVTMVKPL